jgi:RNA polymerase sigma-70 factor (ECF subfamily)
MKSFAQNRFRDSIAPAPVQAATTSVAGGATAADGEDFAAQVAALRRDLYARATFLAQDRVAAEDLVQEACERALLSQDRFQRGSNLRAWLSSIMRNLFIDQRRRTSARLRLEHQAVWTSSEDAPGPLDVLSLTDVMETLNDLSPSDREIFTLAHVDHVSYREIAERLAIPMNTVASRLWRVRAKVRALLEGVCERRLARAH